MSGNGAPERPSRQTLRIGLRLSQPAGYCDGLLMRFGDISPSLLLQALASSICVTHQDLAEAYALFLACPVDPSPICGCTSRADQTLLCRVVRTPALYVGRGLGRAGA